MILMKSFLFSIVNFFLLINITGNQTTKSRTCKPHTAGNTLCGLIPKNVDIWARALKNNPKTAIALIALFISLEEPTRGMIADAASAGFYESATGKKYPRVQLLTIEGLLSGKQRAEHPDHQPDLNFKKAKAESNAAQKDLI